MRDPIERQDAIDALTEYGNGRAVYISVEEAVRRIEQLPFAQPFTDEEIQKMQDLEQAELQKAYEIGRASAQPDIDEWCTDCKEYDNERHCCPRWNRVIRETVKEVLKA